MIQERNIYNKENIQDYKKKCLGSEFLCDSPLCRACEDAFECRDLHKRWIERTKEQFIFQHGVLKVDNPTTKIVNNKPVRQSREELQKSIMEMWGFIKKQG